MRTKKVIKFRQSLFWDTDPKKIDPKKNAPYIIERILDFGEDREIRWMRKYYSPRAIKKVVINSRCLLPMTRNLWKLLLEDVDVK